MSAYLTSCRNFYKLRDFLLYCPMGIFISLFPCGNFYSQVRAYLMLEDIIEAWMEFVDSTCRHIRKLLLHPCIHRKSPRYAPSTISLPYMTFFGVLCCHFFIASWLYYCVATVFHLWGLDDLFHVLFHFWVLSFDRYVVIFVSHASNLTLRGWFYNWFIYDIYCYCYIFLSFINNLVMI